MVYWKRYGRLLLWFIPAFVAFSHATSLRERTQFVPIDVPFRQTCLINGMGVNGVCQSYATVVAETSVTTRSAETLVVGVQVKSQFMADAPVTLHVTHNSLPVTVTPANYRSYHTEDIVTQYYGKFQTRENQAYQVRFTIENVSAEFPDTSLRMTVEPAPQTLLARALPVIGLFCLGIAYMIAGIIGGIQIRYRERGRSNHK